MSGFSDLYNNVLLGIQVAVSPSNLMYCLLGVFLVITHPLANVPKA